ncbi:MAG TPA: hypothetical protein VGA67_05535 [Candidatus Dojkabacteria bacterium]
MSKVYIACIPHERLVLDEFIEKIFLPTGSNLIVIEKSNGCEVYAENVTESVAITIMQQLHAFLSGIKVGIKLYKNGFDGYRSKKEEKI